MKNFTLGFTIIFLILVSATVRHIYAKPSRPLPSIGFTRITTQKAPHQKLQAYPSGKIFIPDSVGGNRHVLVPVIVTNCWDSIPITSFEFSVKYDYKVVHPVGVSVNGPGISCFQNSGLAKNFTITYTDAVDPGGLGVSPHLLKVKGTSIIPLGLTTPPGNDCALADTVDLLYISFLVMASSGDGVHSTLLRISNDTGTLHWNTMSPLALFPPDSSSDPFIGLCGPNKIDASGNIVQVDTTNQVSGRGAGNIVVTQQPVIEFGDDGTVIQLDGNNYELTTLLEADATVHNTISRLFTIDNPVPGTRMNCLRASSNVGWLNIGKNPDSGTLNYTITPDLDHTTNSTQNSQMLYVIVNPDYFAANNMTDSTSGVFQGVISFVSDEASNSPANLSVTFFGTPSDITVHADSGTSTALVNYIPAPVSESGGYLLTYDPPSGSTFPVGKSTVLLTIRDNDSNEITRTFTVTVIEDGPVDSHSMNISGGKWIIGSGVTFSLPGGITIRGSGIVEVDSGATLIVVGGITLADSGTLDNRGTVKLSGDWMKNGGLLTGNGTVEFNGTTPQIVKGSQITTFDHLTINNPSGIHLKKNVVIAGEELTFIKGKIFTDSSDCILYSLYKQRPRVIGADDSKYIVTSKTGHATLSFDSAFSNVLVPIGDAYAPVTLSVNGVAAGRMDITSYTTTGTNPYENTPTPNASGIDQGKKCDHYWVMTKSGSGNYATYDATFDLTYTENTGDISKYIVRMYDSATGWTTPPSAISGTNITVTGLTSFGDFVIGELITSGINSPVTNAWPPYALINSVVPNPGSGTMTFTYTLAASEDVRLELFNTIGQSIALLSEGFRTQGEHQNSFNVGALAEGIYYLRLTTQFAKASAIVKVIH